MVRIVTSLLVRYPLQRGRHEEDAMKSTGPSNGRERRYTGDKGISKTHGDAVLNPYGLVDLYGPPTRGLKSRHAQMIALGDTIGTGLFDGSGATLAKGGQASSWLAMSSWWSWCYLSSLRSLKLPSISRSPVGACRILGSATCQIG